MPKEMRAGSGFTRLAIHHGEPVFKLTAHGDAEFRGAARPGPTAPITALALSHAAANDFTGTADPVDADLMAKCRFDRANEARTDVAVAVEVLGRRERHLRGDS